jgi:hypothetical protein
MMMEDLTVQVATRRALGDVVPGRGAQKVPGMTPPASVQQQQAHQTFVNAMYSTLLGHGDF